MSEETYSYEGWLNSDSFIKRSLAVCGYSILPLFIILIVIPFFIGLFFGFLF